MFLCVFIMFLGVCIMFLGVCINFLVVCIMFLVVCIMFLGVCIMFLGFFIIFMVSAPLCNRLKKVITLVTVNGSANTKCKYCTIKIPSQKFRNFIVADKPIFKLLHYSGFPLFSFKQNFKQHVQHITLYFREGLHQEVATRYQGGSGGVVGGALHLLSHHPQQVQLPHRRQGQEGHRDIHQEET
jgi:hypothetical protein